MIPSFRRRNTRGGPPIVAEIEIFKLFLLVVARFGGLIASAPILGSGNIPVVAKVGLTGLSAMLITPLLPAMAEPLPAHDLAFALMASSEFLIGLAMGFVMTLVFGAIQVAGQIMDLQTGFGMVNVFNPALETQFPIFGFFLFILAVLYLLVLGGHHVMLRALAASYEHIPVGGFVVRPALLYEVGRWGQALFVDGLMVAAPVVTAMLLAYVTLGLLGRVIPQIHLLVVGFPITIATGLFLTAFMLGVYFQVLDGMFFRMFRNVETLMRGMG